MWTTNTNTTKTTTTRTTTTMSSSFSSFITTKTNSVRSQTSIKPAADVCPYIRLSESDEEILIVQNLKTRIEPNHDISEAVNRAIARHTERVDRHIEIVENGFKSINNEIERKILEASQALDKSLNVIDNSLSTILDDQKSDEFMQFDSLKKCFLVVNDLINERNQNINSFMNVLYDFEKERTALIKDCYQQHMLNVKQLSGDSFVWLYEKYLKNYNTIKLGNFRTYEDLRYQLVQWSSTLHQDFILRAYDVKIKIKKNIGESFKNKFISDARTIISDTIEYTQSTFISCLLNDLNELFDELIQILKKQMGIAFILKCSDSLKICLKKIDKINENATSLHSEAYESIQSLLAKTMKELNNTVIDSDEFLSPKESTVINNAITNEAISLQQEKMKSTLEVQLFLSDVKNVINTIGSMIRPAIEILCSHFGRLMKARNMFFVALDKQFKTNDSELEMLENNFSEELEALVQASDETKIRKFENMCIDTLGSIKDRIQVNRKIETEIISDYIDLIAIELDVVGLEVEVVMKLVPEDLKAFPKFNDAMQNESWSTSTKTSITAFERTVNDFQYTLHKSLWAFILELKSVDLMDDEMTWTSLLEQGIDERFNVAEHLVQFRIIGVQGEITKKRIDEIEQHKNLLEHHMETALETSNNLKHKTNEIFKLFDLKKTLILKNVKKININELPITELTEVMNELKYQVYLAATEINNMYKLHYNDIESKHQEIENSTLEFMKSIKMFPEGGNYGHEEAISTIHMLNDLSHTMDHKKTSIFKKLKKNNYESVTDIKQMLYELIKPVEVELDKKILKQKYYSIYNLLNVTTNQEILNLEKILDSLQTKLNIAKKIFEKKDIVALSKCWSEILSETTSFIDFVVESYQDIQALLMYKIKKSIWNTKSEKMYMSSIIAMNSKHNDTFTRGKFQFYDYCKTIICCGGETVTDRPRFLKNIYSAIFHYILESQINAADLAIIESVDNTWIDKEPDTAVIYTEIMTEAVKNSREIALQSELIWIFKLSEFFDLFTDLYAIECQFKNAVLATYHEDSVSRLNEASSENRLNTEAVRKQLKNFRQEFHYKLKPSHGHPRNTWRLESLISDFQLFNAECLETLSATCDRIVIDLEKISKNYETMCPKDVLVAATVNVKCYMKLKTLMEHIDDSKFVDSGHGSSRALSESMTSQSFQLAVSNVKNNLQTKAGTIFWPDNSQLWTFNVQVFSRLCRERFDDVETFSVVEKAKMIDWATTFVRDVERVKELGQYVTI
ncbi:uncharacterized protein LOC114122403 [Aphis gossypii]|uniref:uncharacterized protein LOC114122403 n=1 Tax=Aphis gossypii TaxID=80765 RepID=UPI0021598561|nr:uncharacterized protein LOC114122403 [Aphis gossypii]XP_050057143.1 uncharacterized protein LOC114122403 [Aphis gossypii]